MKSLTGEFGNSAAVAPPSVAPVTDPSTSSEPLEKRCSPGEALLYGSGMMGGAVLVVAGLSFLTQPNLIRGWQQYFAGSALTAYGLGWAYVSHWLHKGRET